MKKMPLFLAVQATLFTFAVSNVTAMESTVELIHATDETSTPQPADLEIVLDKKAKKVVTFGIVGDMPYSDKEVDLLTLPDGKIAQAIRALNPPVLIHYGDFNKGSNSCTDDSFIELKQQIADLLPSRVIYTPGDNDWTDCDRTKMSVRFDELERLEFVKNLFYSDTEMYQDVVDVKRQEGYVENATWEIDGLVFGTLHIVGTNNGRAEILLGDVNKALDEADSRDEHNKKWLDELMEKAKDKKGLVVAFQADIYHPEEGVADRVCDKINRQDCDGMKRIRDQIETKAKTFNKPFLIVHGDTNAFCLNQPVKEAHHFWHLNGPGDYTLLDAAKVVFDPENKAKPFSVFGLTDERAYPEVCNYSHNQ